MEQQVMSPYGTFTPEEWTMVKSAPMIAANLVVVADPSGPIDTIREVMAAARAVAAKNSAYASSGLVSAVLTDWEADAEQAKAEKLSAIDFAKQQMPQLPQFKSAAEMTDWLAASLTETVAFVSQKSPEDLASLLWLRRTLRRKAASLGSAARSSASRNTPRWIASRRFWACNANQGIGPVEAEARVVSAR
jgi:hypothetical protein